MQTVAAPDGELLWVSGVLPGRTVDITAARRFGIADKVLAYLGLLADLGYIGLHPEAIVGYKRKRGEKTLPAGKKAANIALAGIRAIGERANAQLKRWKVLASDFRGSPTTGHHGGQGGPGPAVHDPRPVRPHRTCDLINTGPTTHDRPH